MRGLPRHQLGLMHPDPTYKTVHRQQLLEAGSHRGLFDLRQRLFPQVLFLQAFSPIIPTHFGIRRMHSHSAPSRLHCLSFLLDPASALLTGVIGFLLASSPSPCVHKHADTAFPPPPFSSLVSFVNIHAPCDLAIRRLIPHFLSPLVLRDVHCCSLLKSATRRPFTTPGPLDHWPHEDLMYEYTPLDTHTPSLQNFLVPLLEVGSCPRPCPFPTR
jgi:hypothetical protein